MFQVQDMKNLMPSSNSVIQSYRNYHFTRVPNKEHYNKYAKMYQFFDDVIADQDDVIGYRFFATSEILG